MIVMYGLQAQIIKQNGSGSFLENKFSNFDFYRQTGHTVRAFDIINSGGAMNSNKWSDGRVNSNNCTSTPFFRMENSSTAAAFANDNVWMDSYIRPVKFPCLLAVCRA